MDPALNLRAMGAGRFLYDSHAYDAELPHWLGDGQRAHLVVPYTLLHNQRDQRNYVMVLLHMVGLRPCECVRRIGRSVRSCVGSARILARRLGAIGLLQGSAC